MVGLEVGLGHGHLIGSDDDRLWSHLQYSLTESLLLVIMLRRAKRIMACVETAGSSVSFLTIQRPRHDDERVSIDDLDWPLGDEIECQ